MIAFPLRLLRIVVPALLVAGCGRAATPVHIDAMADEARSNEIAATDRYSQLELILVDGYVEDLGMFNEDRAVASGTSTRAVARLIRVQTPYVVLRAEGGGQLLCYFVKNRAEAATLSRKQYVSLVGRFQGFHRAEDGVMAVMTDCRLPDD